MDEHVVAELEAAIADAGALLVRLQKYRAGTGTDAAALERAVFALGDSARRLHRRDELDGASVSEHCMAARDLLERLRRLLDHIRDTDTYRIAVTAHAAGDHTTLASLLPQIFAGLSAASVGSVLYSHPIAWRRHGRPRTPHDLAQDIVALRARGILAEGDDLSPGVDPLLPAVALRATIDMDEPIALEVAPDGLPPVYRLDPCGDFLVYVPRLHVPFRVLVAAVGPPDAAELALDYPAYRSALLTALNAADIAVA